MFIIGSSRKQISPVSDTAVNRILLKKANAVMRLQNSPRIFTHWWKFKAIVDLAV